MPTCPAPALDVLRTLAILLSFAAGCRADCRTLCSEWYDFQRDVCGVVDTTDQRVGCIADYRSAGLSDEEQDACVVARVQLATLRDRGTDDQKTQCCQWDAAQCDLRDAVDDDSASP